MAKLSKEQKEKIKSTIIKYEPKLIDRKAHEVITGSMTAGLTAIGIPIDIFLMGGMPIMTSICFVVGSASSLMSKALHKNQEYKNTADQLFETKAEVITNILKRIDKQMFNLYLDYEMTSKDQDKSIIRNKILEIQNDVEILSPTYKLSRNSDNHNVKYEFRINKDAILKRKAELDKQVDIVKKVRRDNVVNKGFN